MKLRTSNIEQLAQGRYDVLVIGGGINGAVAAAALSGKGAKVALIEQRDFAGFTSQQSSNLAWGGIKYLESLDFGLVRDLCLSRNQLITNYPSRVEEIRFYSMIEKGFRFHPLFIWLAPGSIGCSAAPSPKRRAGCRSRRSMPRNQRSIRIISTAASNTRMPTCMTTMRVLSFSLCVRP